MAWVTWRQHRLQLAAVSGLLGALAVALVGSHVPIGSAYHRDALSSCLPPSSRSGCDILVRHFQDEFSGLTTTVRGLAVLPVLAGLFVGAPLLARELEHGTHRFAWTQAITRRQWLLSKTAWLALAVAAAGAVVSVLVTWWRGPFDTLGGRMSPSAFDIEGLVVPAYALYALALGVLAGLLLRRTVAAMTVTLVAFAATRLLVVEFVRPHFLAPLHQTVGATDSGTQSGAWVLSDTLVDAAGRTITSGREDIAVLHAQQAGIDPHTYFVTLGWKRAISYQPAGRFWTFQLIEAGVFIALAAAVVALTLYLVRRTPR